ncbi:hypothetical protein QTP86_032094 [Hemibagrus guttatus]|nr:hypothetical protein QTP86_032094 [Hemibagrus guttatus]
MKQILLIDLYVMSGMSPLSPYLNVDPKYLIQDAEEFILPTGANKTRGRFELAFFTIGSCCISGSPNISICSIFSTHSCTATKMGLISLMVALKHRGLGIINLVTRQGATWANTLGSLALLYSVFGVIIEKTRGAEDDLNTMAAGTMTGILYKCPGGLRGAVRGGVVGFALSGLYALYNNWDHLKGNSPTRY